MLVFGYRSEKGKGGGACGGGGASPRGRFGIPVGSGVEADGVVVVGRLVAGAGDGVAPSAAPFTYGSTR